MGTETNSIPSIEFPDVSLSFDEKQIVIIEEVTSEQELPPLRVIVLHEGRMVFTGSVPEFEASPTPAVTRLTHADNGTVVSDYAVSDPWDKRRRPLERVL